MKRRMESLVTRIGEEGNKKIKRDKESVQGKKERKVNRRYIKDEEKERGIKIRSMGRRGRSRHMTDPEGRRQGAKEYHTTLQVLI